ncbi:MAG: IclR family transcriptional regulator, partial [Proteobacteria bacterium]|nr:IclR family transcriptional regulator [Pseudomonadota bacterium]
MEAAAQPAGTKKIESTEKPLVPAVEQAAMVLICLANNSRPQMTLTRICREVGIHKSKGYNILKTLRRFGLVERDESSKTYSLGYGLLHLARRVLDHLDYRAVASPFLEDLATRTRSTALLGILSAAQVFVVAKHEGDQGIGLTIRVGHRFHFTAGAHGKALVAFLPPEEQRAVLARDKLFFYGPKTMPAQKMPALKKELAECRDRGFATDAGGLQPGVNAVSAPVFGPGNVVIGCLILIGTFPKNLMDRYGRAT